MSSISSNSKRWVSSSFGRQNVHSLYKQPIGSSSMTHIGNCYEAEDILSYDRALTVGNSTGSLCGIGGSNSISEPTRSSRYYSPFGTSYTIVERQHSPQFEYNSAGDGQYRGLKPRGIYLESLNQNGHETRTISPERMFPTASSPPTSYLHCRTNGRSSPSMSSSSCHVSGRERSMVTKTVSMCRSPQPDGTQGFGICVKGGRETGSYYLRLVLVQDPLFIDELRSSRYWARNLYFEPTPLYADINKNSTINKMKPIFRYWCIHFSYWRGICSREVWSETWRYNSWS